VFFRAGGSAARAIDAAASAASAEARIHVSVRRLTTETHYKFR
jgi:hypothetical protein